MSGDWQRLHRVRGVCSGSPENHLIPWSHKAKNEEPKTELQQLPTGLTGDFEAEDAHRYHKACVEAKQFAVAGIRPMVLRRQFPKVPLVGVYPSLGLRGNLVFRVASI
jgi:hypothetical protein